MSKLTISLPTLVAIAFMVIILTIFCTPREHNDHD